MKKTRLLTHVDALTTAWQKEAALRQIHSVYWRARCLALKRRVKRSCEATVAAIRARDKALKYAAALGDERNKIEGLDLRHAALGRALLEVPAGTSLRRGSDPAGPVWWIRTAADSRAGCPAARVSGPEPLDERLLSALMDAASEARDPGS